MMRRWECAVLCRRSMHSVAKETAVLKPKVSTVDSRPLSIVLGTDNTETFLVQFVRNDETAVASDGDERIDLLVAEPPNQFAGVVHFSRAAVRLFDHATERIAAVGGTENCAAEMGNLADYGATELHQSAVRITLGFQHSVLAFANAENPPPQASRCVDGAMDHSIEAGRIPASGVNGNCLDRVGQFLPPSLPV